VYIVRTLSDTLYIGITADLTERIKTHNIGKGAEWTKVHSNVRLMYSEPHSTLSSARKRENQLKRWSCAKKEALIAGDRSILKQLSRCRSTVAHGRSNRAEA
jgi:predicted GIY-YIG superfamily endonuclease